MTVMPLQLDAPDVRARPVDDLSDLRLVLFSDTYAPQVNGVARTLARLVDALCARGGSVRVVTADVPGAVADDPDVVRWPGRAFWAYPELRLARPRVAEARALLRDARATLVHVATPFGVGLAGRRAAQLTGIPLVSSYHTSFSAYAGHYGLGLLTEPGWRFLRWFHGGGRRTFVPTAAVARELKARGFRGLGVWGRGVDAERFAPAHRDAELRARWGASPGDIVLLHVGRLAREKGLDLLFDAVVMAQVRLAAVRGGVPRLRIVIVGDGPHEAALRARAPEGTVFAGKLTGDALSSAYASADLFGFASTTDTFGNVLLEAMASGLAVAAVDAPPTVELLEGGACGRVSAPDAASLSDAILELATSAGTRAMLAGRAREAALRRTWDEVFDALFAEYRRAAR